MASVNYTTGKIRISAQVCINFKFFTRAFIGYGHLKEAGAYLFPPKLRNIINFCMQVYGANTLLSC